MDESYFDKKEEFDQWGKRLPHWHQSYKYAFITFRLNDSLPQSFIKEYTEKKAKWYANNPKPWTKEQYIEHSKLFIDSIDRKLDNGYGSCILAKKEICDIVESTLRYYSGIRYNLISYVIMSNHVHILIKLGECKIDTIIDDWKSWSSRKIKAIENIDGPIWYRRYYDRLIRNSFHYTNVLQYILKNYYKSRFKARYFVRNNDYENLKS